MSGTDASLSVDRISGNLLLAQPGKDAQLLETASDPGNQNRFSEYVFPAIRAQTGGQQNDHPNLYDGWRVQLFTDACVLSAKRGGWVELSELDTQSE